MKIFFFFFSGKQWKLQGRHKKAGSVGLAETQVFFRPNSWVYISSKGRFNEGKHQNVETDFHLRSAGKNIVAKMVTLKNLRKNFKHSVLFYIQAPTLQTN